MHDISRLSYAYGKHHHPAYYPNLSSVSFHRLAEVDGNFMILGGDFPPKSLHRDADTIQYLRLMESIGEPIKPEPDFNTSHGIHLFTGGWPLADGKYFEFAMQPLDDYEIFHQRHWRGYWGWLFPYLYRDSYVLNGRWSDWFDAELENSGYDAIAKVEHLGIVYETPPRIEKLFHYCFDLIAPDWRVNEDTRHSAMIYLFDWMLYGLGHPLQRESPIPLKPLNSSSFEILAQVLPPSIKLFMLWPRAHFSYLLEEISDMAKTPFLEERMPNQPQLELLGKFLSDSVESPSDPILFGKSSGPVLVTASNYSNMIIPMTDCTLTATAGIIDLYLQSPFTAFPCQWEFLKSSSAEKESLVIWHCHSEIDEIDLRKIFSRKESFSYYPFVFSYVA